MESHNSGGLGIPVTLPCDGPGWPDVKHVLSLARKDEHLDGYLDCMEKAWEYTRRKEEENPFLGLRTMLGRDERMRKVFSRVIPTLIDLALAIEEHRPAKPLAYSLQGRESETCLSRAFVASLLASMFLCLIPPQEERKDKKFTSDGYSDFYEVLRFGLQTQKARLEMVLNYFDCLRRVPPKGTIKFRRIVLEPLPSWESWAKKDTPLCPFNCLPGRIEDYPDAMQVDFADEYIGGLTLEAGELQEEIMFTVCPELQVSMLFMEKMESNECIQFEGHRRYSLSAGYNQSLRYAGSFYTPESEPHENELPLMATAIDAIDYSSMDVIQYTKPSILRDVNKAYLGFQQPSVTAQQQSKGSATVQDKDDLLTFNVEDFGASLAREIIPAAYCEVKMMSLKSVLLKPSNLQEALPPKHSNSRLSHPGSRPTHPRGLGPLTAPLTSLPLSSVSAQTSRDYLPSGPVSTGAESGAGIGSSGLHSTSSLLISDQYKSSRYSPRMLPVLASVVEHDGEYGQPPVSDVSAELPTGSLAQQPTGPQPNVGLDSQACAQTQRVTNSTYDPIHSMEIIPEKRKCEQHDIDERMSQQAKYPPSGYAPDEAVSLPRTVGIPVSPSSFEPIGLPVDIPDTLDEFYARPSAVDRLGEAVLATVRAAVRHPEVSQQNMPSQPPRSLHQASVPPQPATNPHHAYPPGSRPTQAFSAVNPSGNSSSIPIQDPGRPLAASTPFCDSDQAAASVGTQMCSSATDADQTKCKHRVTGLPACNVPTHFCKNPDQAPPPSVVFPLSSIPGTAQASNAVNSVGVSSGLPIDTSGTPLSSSTPACDTGHSLQEIPVNPVLNMPMNISQNKLVKGTPRLTSAATQFCAELADATVSQAFSFFEHTSLSTPLAQAESDQAAPTSLASSTLCVAPSSPTSVTPPVPTRPDFYSSKGLVHPFAEYMVREIYRLASEDLMDAACKRLLIERNRLKRKTYPIHTGPEPVPMETNYGLEGFATDLISTAFSEVRHDWSSRLVVSGGSHNNPPSPSAGDTNSVSCGDVSESSDSEDLSQYFWNEFVGRNVAKEDDESVQSSLMSPLNFFGTTASSRRCSAPALNPSSLRHPYFPERLSERRLSDYFDGEFLRYSDLAKRRCSAPAVQSLNRSSRDELALTFPTDEHWSDVDEYFRKEFMSSGRAADRRCSLPAHVGNRGKDRSQSSYQSRPILQDQHGNHARGSTERVYYHNLERLKSYCSDLSADICAAALLDARLRRNSEMSAEVKLSARGNRPIWDPDTPGVYFSTREKRAIATGNWGCGAFGGDAQLKAMIQWVAASEAGCPILIYLTFNEQRLDMLLDIAKFILRKSWTVADIIRCLEKYLEDNSGGTLFDYIKAF